MCEKKKSAFENKNYFYAKNYFSKILIALKGVNMKFRFIKKNMQSFQRYSFQQNRSNGPMVFIETIRQRRS